MHISPDEQEEHRLLPNVAEWNKKSARGGKSMNLAMERSGPMTIVLLTALLVAAMGCTPTPKAFQPPAKTEWAPEGCRAVPTDDPVIGSRTFFRVGHADTGNSDEISIALAPVFEADWVAETAFYLAAAPSFDADGNVYFCPLWPGEEVALVSVAQETGARRWALPHAGRPMNGGGVPLVLEDPANPGEQMIYLGLYDRAMAVKTDGTVVWDVPTGLPQLTPEDDPVETHTFGINYHPQTDSLIALTGDGHLYVLDRKTGAPFLASPHQLPGEKSPLAPPLGLPDAIIAKVNQELLPMMGGLPAGYEPFDALYEVLLGGGKKVANFFSIDPHTGRLWVAATAPDAEDGTVDGVSQFGALYGLDLVPNGGSDYTLVEVCHQYFEGGTASTPSLRADGTRIYVGDANDQLIALDDSCNQIWSLNVGAQLVGSVAVASDNGEIYLPTLKDVIKVADRGTYAEEIWRSPLDAYEPGLMQENYNLMTATVGANGIFVQLGSGFVISGESGQPIPLPLKVGVALLDRETGAVRYFSDGMEESVATSATGPDGACYVNHSPMRRALSRALFGDLTHPVVGGLQRYAPRRLDLQIRDAVCAAAARASNAHANVGTCPDSAEADIRQIGYLIQQSRDASSKAIGDGDLTSADWTTLDGYLTDAEANLSLTTLDVVAGHLQQACDFFPW
jgi:outer membrane protein assembly factor BamB